MSRLVRSVVLTVVLAGCSTTPPSILPPPARDVYLHAPAERVWGAVLAYVTDNDVPVAMIHRSSWFLQTGPMVIPRPTWADSLVDCGKNRYGEPLSHSGVVLLRYTVLLRQAGDSTGLRMAVTTTASGVECVSRGRYESGFVEGVKSRLLGS